MDRNTAIVSIVGLVLAFIGWIIYMAVKSVQAHREEAPRDNP